MNFAEQMEVVKGIDAEAVRLRDKLLADISDLPLNGEYINDGKDGGPVIAIIKFSSLNDNWSPEYLLPAAQAWAIKRKLADLKTAHGICAAVRKMLEDGFVLNSSDKTYLNAKTIEAVRGSELGKYVIATDKEL